eukprot:6199673-Pyramimonas_sp.AAC.1
MCIRDRYRPHSEVIPLWVPPPADTVKQRPLLGRGLSALFSQASNTAMSGVRKATDTDCNDNAIRNGNSDRHVA